MFVGSVNSARMHCSLLTWSATTAEREKKKKRRKRRLKTQTSFQYYPNRTLDLGRVRVVLYYYVL